MKRNKDIYEESLPVYYWMRTELKKELMELVDNKEMELDTILPTTDVIIEEFFNDMG